MLKRQKVPKQFAELADTYGPHITAEDLMVGGHLMIFGRQFFLYACDDSTKEFMKTNFDLTDEDFPDLVDSVLEADEPLPEMPVPPHTGIGDPEDSLQSVYSLVPRPPRRDVAKLLKFEGKVIRWKAALKSSNPDDEGRVFVISFNLADDTMSIFEPPIKNSGIVGGSFMSREKVWKPGCKFQETYCLEDFQEGNIVVAHGHEFILQESDDFTKKLIKQMETGEGVTAVDSAPFSTMDPEEAMRLFRQKLSIRNKRAFWQFTRIIDKDHSGTISMDEMWEGCKLFNVDITREDMEEILRRFDKDGNGQIDYREMAVFMGEETG
jgi:Ca2+-binding EF-hand superfamily protein